MHYRGLFVGLTTIDIQYFVTEFPDRNTKVKTNAPNILVGGPATNASVAFSYLNNGAYLATVVGQNSFTSFIQNDLGITNVDWIDLVENQHINPVVASVVTSGNGDRNIFTHNPAVVQPDIVPNELFEKVNPEILLLDGFYPEFSLECAKLAKSKNIPVVIDCGSWKPQYEEILKFTDIAICSADFLPPGTSDSNDVFETLTDIGVGAIAISRGHKNILVQHNERDEIRVNSCKAVDTLGAGDFLHGAFCYYFLKYNDFRLALEKASKLATFSCGYKGTRQWLKISKFL